MIQPITPAEGSSWKTLNRGPHFTISGFAFNEKGEFPILYRSDKVRSAKNAWSIPSGLHELGLLSHHQFDAELVEEMGLKAIDANTSRIHGYYENIVCNKPGEDNWHWVIGVISVQVHTLDTLVNREPHKHSEIRIVSAANFDPSTLTWTPGLGEWLAANWLTVRAHIMSTVKLGVPI